MRQTTNAKSLYQAFENNALLRANNVAVVLGEKRVTFLELYSLAEKLARRLSIFGVKHGDHVGVYLNRSIEMVVSLLAILRCGAAYVPLDKKYPEMRIIDILNDAKCKCVIGTKDTAKANLGNIFYLDDNTSATSELEHIEELSGLEDTAYIIYTSGSTGKPKGVMIQHKNVLSMLNWASSVYMEEEREGILASTSICFDLSVFEIFLPLTFGGTVVLVENILALDELKNSHPITLINTVPSAIRELLKLKKIPTTVTTINLAGEPLRQDLVDKLYNLKHVKKVYNLYAPSETTTYSTYYLAQPQQESVNVPIGIPIDGTNIYILDDFLNPMPPLGKGEIYIQGDGLSKGYLGNLAETEKKFIEHSFDRKKTVRLYKTGDIARMRRNKIIEFLGRADTQIKIRGFRIELGEIEANLISYPTIDEAAVILHTTLNGENQEIVAFFTANDVIDVVLISNYLADRIPSYALPNRFVQLEKLPLTPNGKIDKAKLMDLANEQSSETSVCANVDDSDLKLLVSLWQELFINKTVTVESNFFRLGGHSLLASQLAYKIHEAFDCEFPLATIFYKPTLLAQLEHIKFVRNSRCKNLPPITKSYQVENVPLSYAQHRMWFLEKLQPNKAISNIPCLIRLRGKINKKAIIYALNKILERHTALRTHYKTNNGVPVQSIRQHKDIFLSEYDMCHLSESKLHDFIHTEAHRKFDFDHDVLLRASLLQIDINEYYLLLTLHHLSADAWSLNILTREVEALYCAFCDGIDTQLPEVVNYVDYSLWQNQHITNESLTKQIGYWTDKLSNATESNPLPLDKPRPELNDYAGAFYKFVIPEELTRAIEQVCLQHELTKFMFLLSGYFILLHAYSAQEDICVGTPIANRGRKEIENTIGLFVNTLVLRCQLDDKTTIEEIFQQVKRTTLEAYENQDLPFEELVNLLGNNTNNNKNPLFQVFIALQDSLPEAINLPGVEAEVIDFDRKISKFDLTFSFQSKKEHIEAIVEYSTNLFLHETIQRLTEHYINVLTLLTKESENVITNIFPLNQSEYEKILTKWNIANDDPQDELTTVLSCFDASVKKYPNRIAIISGKDRFSYFEINEKANVLAVSMLSSGVTKKVAVGLYMDRSTEMIVSLLAIMKLGAYCVPLATDLPEERLSFFIEDAGVNFVITNKRLSDNLPMCDVIPICIDELSLQSTDASSFPKLAPKVNGDDIIYVVYTSGTTGKPKGVVTLHRNVPRLVKNPNYVTLNEKSVILQISPLSFDGATFEIWGCLANGGTLVLMPPGVPELNVMVDLIKKHHVNTLFVTTQLFNALVDYHVEKLSGLQTVLFGGEAASIAHANKFLQSNKQCRLCNIYGPTETTTYACYYEIPEFSVHEDSIPIGKPINNTSMYILDRYGRPVPINVVGEIYIGGQGLARGYLNQEKLTREKFRQQKFINGKEERLYRTGDLGRYDRDGNIYFVGRVDDQIKRSGYRVELAEIESVIRGLPQINEAVVLYNESLDLLKCYLLVADQEFRDVSQLKKVLERKLPDYMLPTEYVLLDMLPLTKSGKIDKTALQAYDTKKQKELTPSVVMGNSVEDIIFSIWKSVLKFDEFTYEDNFFDLGGNSLKMIHVLDQLQSELAKLNYSNIPDMVELFTYPSISTLAEYIVKNSQSDVNEVELLV